MYGISIFMNQEMTPSVVSYVEKMAKLGIKGIFTSMHIPEDEVSLYQSRLEKLGALAKAHHLSLMVDISGNALVKAGFSFEKLEEIQALGVTGLRMDYQISHEIIAKVSQSMKVSLNASTLTQEDINALKNLNANFKNLEAWHNYYPRPETGLSKELFLEKNEFLKRNGFETMAFIPGNAQLRHPLYLGLPTLEEHRYKNPFYCLLEMEKMGVDHIYVGDGGLKKRTMEQLSGYINEHAIILEAKKETESFKYIEGRHENRQDAARDVIRSAHARFLKIPEIQPEHTVERKKGSITLDNCNYGRYMGEIQITKCDLPQDLKVNVVGQVIDEDLDLVKLIEPGQLFIIREEKK